MSLNKKLKALVESVDGALGAAVVEADSGLIIAVHHKVPYLTQSYMDAVGGATAAMFRGQTVSRVEKLLGAQRGETKVHLIQEIQMTSNSMNHFLAVIPGKENKILTLTTSNITKVGMGWSALRHAFEEISPLCS